MANISRWSPFRDPFQVRDDMMRLFNLPAFKLDETETLANGWSPAVDIYEDTEGITVKAEVAGIDPKDIEVKVNDNVLTVKGERKLENQEKKDNYSRIERFYGTFMRSFTLPPTVDAEKIHAESKNGVLRVFLPKKAESKPKQIAVKAN